MAERRTRRVHNKVRSGCLTCKIRRKKCDETKPNCQRCISTGRTCDGYAASPVPRSQTPSNCHNPYPSPADSASNELQSTSEEQTLVADMVQIKLIRNPNIFTLPLSISDLESHCLSFFRCQTGPEFACNSNSLIWCPYNLHAAATHPVLFRAAVALGAVHRRFNYGISREALEYCGHASKFYNSALRALQDFRDQTLPTALNSGGIPSQEGEMGVDDRNIIMTAELWLGLFQVFQGETKIATEHMRRALQCLFNTHMTLTHTESQSQSMHTSLEGLFDILAELRSRVTCLLDLASLVSVNGSGELPMIPEKFQSLEHAYNVLCLIIDCVLRLPLIAWYHVDQRDEICKRYINRLVRWRMAYVETTLLMHRTLRQKRACTLMGLMRTTTHLILHHLTVSSWDAGISSGNELQTPSLNIDLARLHLLVKNVSDDNCVFNFAEQSLGIKSTVVCQTQEPCSLEKDDEQQWKTWRPAYDVTIKTWGVYGLIEHVQTIGSNVLANIVGHMLPAHIKPYSIDMGLLFEDRKMLLRYSYPDKQRLVTTWTQQWWTF